MKTSFVRKGSTRKRLLPPQGTRPSTHNGQLLISSGLSDLDSIIVGGFAVGTLILVEEDHYSSYYDYIARYFLAEGAANAHTLCLASTTSSNTKFVKTIPRVVSAPSGAAEHNKQQGATNKDLKIAWQYGKYLNQERDYKKLSSQSNLSSKNWCHTFDVSKPVKPEDIERLDVTDLDFSHLNDFQAKCQALYTTLSKMIYERNQEMVKTKKGVILRILIRSFGSAAWGDVNKTNIFLTFLHALRGLLRSSLAVCMITLPAHAFKRSLNVKIGHLADYIFTMQAFNDSSDETGAAFKDFDGLFHIKKLPYLNSLTNAMPRSPSFTFKLQRKKLSIETIHLPPEDFRTTSADNSKESKSEKARGQRNTKSVQCQPGPEQNKLLEF
mmetsp:Transcript_5021/g.5468  ORF Transcript_5021/g.5468 Transcript_5021/m.5468 type:complete len:383 (-) Transcript_5021:12-1160(-)